MQCKLKCINDQSQACWSRNNAWLILSSKGTEAMVFMAVNQQLGHESKAWKHLEIRGCTGTPWLVFGVCMKHSRIKLWFETLKCVSFPTVTFGSH